MMVLRCDFCGKNTNKIFKCFKCGENSCFDCVIRNKEFFSCKDCLTVYENDEREKFYKG